MTKARNDAHYCIIYSKVEYKPQGEGVKTTPEAIKSCKKILLDVGMYCIQKEHFNRQAGDTWLLFWYISERCNYDKLLANPYY
jgi:hypothetical protein